MKKLIIVAALGVVLVGSFSCSKFLDTELQTEIDLAKFGNTLPEATHLLTQAYIEMRNPEISGNVNYTIFPTDYSVAPAATTLSRSDVAKASQVSTTIEVSDIWDAHYGAISRSNLVIERADMALSSTNLSDADIASWKKLSGEARFLRAYLYFNLVRYYRNVPIIEKFFKTLADVNMVSNLPDDQMKEQENRVYDFIIQDLLKASEYNLPLVAERGRAGRYAVLTLLGKVYLNRATIEKYRDNSGTGADYYQKSADALSEVISSNAYKLKTYYPDNFIRDKQYTGNNEFIFTIEFSEADNGGTRAGDGSGFVSASAANGDILGSTAGANGAMNPTDFGWSVYDYNSPGDIVRRFWTFEQANFVDLETNGISGVQNTSADCPTGVNCEIFLRTLEPYQFTRPYWFEVITGNNSFRNKPVAADVATGPNGSYFTTIWNTANANQNPGLFFVKYRRNPLTQANYLPTTYDADIPVFRYSEVLLMFAEAANELVGPATIPTGASLTATEAVNQIRDRARNFVYYPSLNVNSRIIESGPYNKTYGDIFSRQAKVNNVPPPATTAKAADTLAKYYNQVSAFRGLREVPATPQIRNFKEFPATANFVPDFPSSLTPAQFQEALLDERWRELAGEFNMRWFDLTRYGILVDRIEQYKTLVNPLTKRTLANTPFGTAILPTVDSKYEYLPIPFSEISRNPKIHQNFGY